MASDETVIMFESQVAAERLFALSVFVCAAVPQHIHRFILYFVHFGGRGVIRWFLVTVSDSLPWFVPAYNMAEMIVGPQTVFWRN